MGFKDFFVENNNDMSDLQASLKKLPKSHQTLVKGYKFSFENHHTLKGDKGHIGFNDLLHKRIVVAAPWRYPREFAFLHEVGHCVWKKYLKDDEQLKSKWHDIVKSTKKRLKDQNDEELFCHAYANTYSKNKIDIHNHPEWEKFVESLPN